MQSNTALSRLLTKVQTFDTLRLYPNFRLLWLCLVFYQISWWMLMLAMSWLAYEITGSVFLVALFTAARLAPTLLGPFIGALADRMNRRNFMIAAAALQAVFNGILAILVATGLIQFWHLILIGFLGGIFYTAVGTTGYALAMDIAGQKHITNAMALTVVGMDLPMAVGPAIGGVLIATVGAANSIWAATALSLFAGAAIFALKTPAGIITTDGASVLQNIVEGFKYVIHSRDMLAVLSVSLTANLFMWPAFQSFMPIFAKDNLGLGPDGFGFLMTAFGTGALVGALILASMGDFKRKGLIFLAGTALTALFFGAFALSRLYPLALTLVALAGFFTSAFGVLQATLILILAPPAMRGRASGFLRLAIGVYTLGALGMGAVANIIGASLTTAISCGILFFVIIAIAIKMPNLRRL